MIYYRQKEEVNKMKNIDIDMVDDFMTAYEEKYGSIDPVKILEYVRDYKADEIQYMLDYIIEYYCDSLHQREGVKPIDMLIDACDSVLDSDDFEEMLSTDEYCE